MMGVTSIWIGTESLQVTFYFHCREKFQPIEIKTIVRFLVVAYCGDGKEEISVCFSIVHVYKENSINLQICFQKT